MELILYKNESATNVINKTIREVGIVNVNLRKGVDVSKPVLMFSEVNFNGVNYVEIPEFKRFYFVDRVSNVNRKIWQVNLSCDVLSSFKDDFLNSELTVKREIREGDYMEIEAVESVDRVYENFESDVEIESENSIILVTKGGLPNG